MTIACQTTLLGIALTSSLNPSAIGQSVTFTASTTASGTMTFYDGGSIIGTGAIVAGVATLSTSSLSSGQHSISAKTGSLVSNVVIQVVVGGPPFGPLRLDATTLGIINAAMDFLFACNGTPPVMHLTGLMSWNGTNAWVEQNSPCGDPSNTNAITVDNNDVQLNVSIALSCGQSSYVATASLSAFPIGVATFNSGGFIITNCGNVPNIPFFTPGAVTWA